MAVPAWLSSITTNTWGTISGSTLSSSGVMESGFSYAFWNSGIVNTDGLYVGSTYKAGPFFVVWGGGHTDYSGNEVYAFGPLTDDAPAWYELRSPTSPAPSNVAVDGSGNPPSTHLYNSIQYVNGSGRSWMLCMGEPHRYIDGNANNDTYVYDFNQVSPNSNQPWSRKTTVTNGAADICIYNPAIDRVYWHNLTANHLGIYDVGGDALVDESFFESPPGLGGNAHSALDSSSGIWAIYDGTSGLTFVDASSATFAGDGNTDYYTPNTTGTAPTGQGSIIYDSINDYFVLWVGGGKTLWKLTPPATNRGRGGNAWTWSSFTPSGGSTPSAQNTNGTFGRFFFLNMGANGSGYGLHNVQTETMYFFRTDTPAAPTGFDQECVECWIGDEVFA